MRVWKELKVGDKVSFHYNEFDGSGVLHGRVTKVFSDHVIATFYGSDYWLDEESRSMFSKGWN